MCNEVKFDFSVEINEDKQTMTVFTLGELILETKKITKNPHNMSTECAKPQYGGIH